MEFITKRHGKTGVRLYFRTDDTVAKPVGCICLLEYGFLYAVRLPAIDILEREVSTCCNVLKASHMRSL